MKWKIIIALGLFSACQQAPRHLPLLGEPIVRERQEQGKTVYDSIYPVIPPFSFLDQDSSIVNEKTFAGKIYVADFIFLSCPAICPKMTAEMKKVYQAFGKEDRVMLLSHTIDPEHDTIPRLKAYTTSMELDSRKWRFVTGNQDSIYHMAEKAYFSGAYKDSTAPGGYAHSGGLLLIDQQRHIRGVYNGTSPDETKRLISDIHILLKEN
ncbi:SCO family protein [Chitinophaga arvensicola]|uniref:Protein SCO1/2 n=1 Tax=Chitinophaga arvensicola TaxID=29529 RepID=A0A1I0RI07_9BACT|nr:SCO family protein [Chitinophaga arvensicola]SEW40558.1 protein SCO1/2 [Chitinophaga arvensicola]